MEKINNSLSSNDYLLKEELEKIYDEYIKSQEQDFEKYIQRYINKRKYLYLSSIGENVLNWYEFSKNADILVISADCGQITNVLQKNDVNVTQYEQEEIKIKFLEKRFNSFEKLTIKKIETFQDDTKKYDYIILGNILNCDNFEFYISKCTEKLKVDGKILIIFENGNSVNSLSNVDNEYGKLYFLEDKEKITVNKLKSKLEENNILNINMYYIFPNSYIPSIIYEDKFIQKYIGLLSYTPYISENNIIVADEEAVLNQLISEDKTLLKYFANSYLLEVSKNKTDRKCAMVSFNNYRKSQYSLITMVKDGKVYKLPRCEEASSHIENMKKGIKQIRNKDICLLDEIDENEKVFSKYIENMDTLDIVIYKEYKKTNDLKKIADIYSESYGQIKKYAKNYDDVAKNELLADIPVEILNKMHFLDICPWDMVAKNCFYLNGEYVYFDQEWYEVGLPIEFLVYRSVINSYQLVKKINVNELFEILGIDKFVEYFDSINSKLFSTISDSKINELYSNKNIRIDNLIYSAKEVEIYKRMIESYKENNEKQDEYIKNLEKIRDEYEKLKAKSLKQQLGTIFNAKNKRG